jgi:hypothetical protein
MPPYPYIGETALTTVADQSRALAVPEPGPNAFQRVMLGLVRLPLVPIALIGWFLAAIAEDEQPKSTDVSWESASKELGDGMSLVGTVAVSAVLAPFFMALVPPYLMVREVWRSEARRKLHRFLFGVEAL